MERGGNVTNRENFTRRDFLKTTAALSCGLLGTTASDAQKGGNSVIRLSSGPHLFIDDYLIAHQTNLKRAINQPTRLPQPLVTGKEDGNFQPYLTVLRDPQTKRFRIWYDVAVNASQAHIGYMESEDGIHWIHPHRVLDDPATISFGMCVLDEGEKFSDPARRYKLAWWTGGLWIAYSAEGLKWTPAQPRPVLTGISDIIFLARDPIRNRYLATFKMDSTPADGYKGSTPNAPEGYRRCVGQSVSQDCINWTPPRYIFKPDEKDEGITEFYSVAGVIARGDLLIGVLKVLRDDLPCDPDGPANGIGYTVLAWTRDGENWQRDREPFFDRNHERGTWDHAMAWMDYQLIVDDEVYIYYGGYARGHKVERFTERQIGLARMKRDRYVSRDAGDAQGVLRTPLVTLDAPRMTVNANVDGELRARILDEAGKPLKGFNWMDCTTIRGDSLTHPVRWKGDLASLRGKPVQLEFALRQGKFYGFELEK